MRIAVIGVGLIGGSVGLAARERLDAHVTGYDPSSEARDAALERGALDRGCVDVADAVADVEAVFVAAPVSAVGALVGEALAAAPADCVVTDVGSTKRSVVAAHDDSRFVGGHPLAGAETAGVAHARADLFDGATWYLTPGPHTSGILYERLHRLVHGLGARPVAIDPDAHDRMLAAVSHLPHVLANVLVAQAADTLAGGPAGGERLAATGPSFRDATRVAGAPSAIWTDIYLSNRDALLDELDATIARLRSVREALHDGDADAITAWNDGAAADRRSLLEAQLAGGPLFELRVSVPNRPGVVARLALELGRAGVNITDMALYPAPDMTEGVVAMWVAGEDAAERAVALVEGLGFPGGARVNVRFDPGVRLRGRVAPPTDKSISHRAALVGAMSSTPVRVSGYLDAADTRSTLDAVRAVGASVVRDGTELVISGVGLRGTLEPEEPIDVGNAGTLMRLAPGWLSFQEGRTFTLDGDASIRRRPVDRVAAPLQSMGADVEAVDGRFAPLTVRGAALTGIDYTLPVASAQVKSCVLLAGLGTSRTTVRETIPSRDHTERMLLAAGAPVTREPLEGGGWASSVGACDALALERVAVPGDLSSAAFLIAAAVLVPGSAVVLEGVGVNWTRAGFLAILERMGAAVTGALEEPGTFTAAEPVRDLEVASGPLAATTVGADEVPLAIDELPLVALLGCFADGETVVRGAGELRVKESDRIATVVDGLRGLGADIEALPDGFAVRGTGGLRGGALMAHGDHRLAMLGAVAGLASREGVEVVGMDAAAVSYPTFADDLAALSS